ncbi:hypothetical protein F5Y16DRAFT_405542 [Xylariaceae sp. FL0255]|nr:hypothetical protein F5Y16DRAFT_405542 [Xylariaceae sp. FL0255]
MGVDGLAKWPEYLIPEPIPLLEWFYLIDLDMETFGVQNVCFFSLSDISPNFDNLPLQGPDDAYIPLPINHSTQTHPDTAPTIISPCHKSKFNEMPTFVACQHLSKLFFEQHRSQILLSQGCGPESDVLFRELAFALLCFAPCSTEWVHLTSSENIDEGNLHVAFPSGNYGDGSNRSITAFGSSFHLEGLSRGSAPTSTSYWFAGALVFLVEDVKWRGRFYDAFVSVVRAGEAHGESYFHGVIISLEHFILFKRTNGDLEHTKRLKLGRTFEKRSSTYYTIM